MKVTYFELVGQGTILHPTYKAIKVEREEFCDTIVKAGNLWYMIKGGYVHHSIEVENVTKIEFEGATADCKYYANEQYPFTCKFSNQFGYICAGGYKDFAGLIRDIKTYSKRSI